DKEIVNVNTSEVIQFETRYKLPNGRQIFRVSTLDFRWATQERNFAELVFGFDSDATSALISRLTIERALNYDPFDATKVIDRMIIRMSQHFGNFRMSQPDTFKLPPPMQRFPASMFHLRRSRFMRLFNHTPDETAFFRFALRHETTGNMMTMIEPILLSYGLERPPERKPLDVASIQPDTVLLLDCYFRLIIQHGTSIAAWREQGLHLQEDYKHVKKVLEDPIAHAQQILSDRFPAPFVLVCDQGSSQSRYLLAQLNPSSVIKSGDGKAAGVQHRNEGPEDETMLISDDVSYESFFAHLRQIVTTPRQ
ncbi:MAG: putative Protein transport protein SEC23, partial [Streblomastix strix]